MPDGLARTRADVSRIRLRRGLDLPIPGAPEPAIHDAPSATTVAVLGADYPGVRPEFRVGVGDRVALGQPLFVDREQPELCFTSPAAGVVRAVERGDALHPGSIRVERTHGDEVTFPRSGAGELAKQPRERLVALLRSSGLWTALRTRPFGRIADPVRPAAAIFVRAMDTNPLAAPAEVVLRERPEDLELGLAALARLVDGPVFVCVAPGTAVSSPDPARIRVVEFEGPHPAGLPGTHIHHLLPVGGERHVWYLGYQDVLAIGHLLRTGRLRPERVIALAGPRVRRPRLLRTSLGASIEDLVRGELEPGDCRVVSGSLLSGRRAAGPDGYLGRYHDQVSVIAESTDAERRAWPRPGRGSWVMPWLGRPRWTSALHARPRAMLPLELFERAWPLRLHAAFLLRAVAAGDAESARRAGALELEDEDLALCSYLCPSKLEYGPLLVGVLRQLEQELG